MKWFCKHSVCAECKVLFEPVRKDSVDAHWPNLCEAHRAPHRDKYERRMRVVGWAGQNWQKLEAQMIAEHEEERRSNNEALNRMMNSYAQSALNPYR